MKKLKLYNNKVAVVSDLHAGIHQNSTTWYDILNQWSEWFLTQCIQNKIEDIIIPGDVFHHRNEINVQTMDVVYNMLKKFDNFNIIILVGNHDAFYKEDCRIHSLASFDEWENISVVDEITTFDAFGTNITICPWGTEIEEIPKTDILFGHFELNGFHLNKNKVCDNGIVSSDILDKSPLVISGHFHIRDHRKYDRGEIVYVGSAFQHDWGDTETERGYHILDVKTKELKFVENTRSPQHKKIKLSHIIKKGISQELKDEFSHNWIKLEVDKEVDNEKLDSLMNKFNSFHPLSLTLDSEKKTDTEDLEVDYSGVDISECIHEYVDLLEIDYKEEVVDTLLELYKSVSSHE